MKQCNRPLLVIPVPMGQPGNRLTHFAHIQAVALEYNVPLIHAAFEPYASSFEGTRDSALCLFDPAGDFFGSAAATLFWNLLKRFLQETIAILPDVEPSIGNANVSKDRLAHASLERFNQVTTPESRALLESFGLVLRDWSLLPGKRKLPVYHLAAKDLGVDLMQDPQLRALMLETGSSTIGLAPIILLDGWGFRVSEASIKLQRSRILEFLHPVDSISTEIETQWQMLKTLNPSACVVGLHARRGDYAQWQDGRFFFSWERYRAAAEELITKHGGREHVTVLLCSNETPPADTFQGLPVTVSNADAIVDMYLLSRCAAVMGPDSTFTGWSHFVSGALRYRMAPD